MARVPFFVRPVAVQRRLAPLDEAERRRHKRRNLIHSILLLGGMVVLLALFGYLLFGPQGLLGLGLGAALGLLFSPRISPQMVLRLYRARPLQPAQLPQVFEVVDRLAGRAGLEQPPELFYVPSSMLNAFALGRPGDAVIAVTDGMLRTLTLRELAGVFAHEISHIRNNDLWLMGLADVIGRLTRLMVLFGTVLLILGLPLWLTGVASLPWLLIPLLLFAPQITVLLQLALSRARELDADLDAAGLTQDPGGLASALLKLERYQRGLWEQILFPGYRLPEPSLLRSHPPTKQRVERLRRLQPADAQPPSHPITFAGAMPWRAVSDAPRGRLTGFWY